MELVPERKTELPVNPVGARRERPLPRSRVLARHEASAREGGVNQRWYREIFRPLSPTGTGAFFVPSGNLEKENETCRSMRN